MSEGIRIDKWLWAVRIFKTRNQAGEACKAGKIKINDVSVKPSREVKIDEKIIVNLKHITKTVKVIGLLKNRVAAKLVENYLEDLTPQEEYDKQKMMKDLNSEFRQRGIGRPTKKERRLIDRLKKSKF
ncbi:MAG: RNA-binding S4 domain-containing protein [Bacteroidales bacterium]|nr:RNA-binding S4 domain-containing protein [Bacteroidales bacterium]